MNYYYVDVEGATKGPIDIEDLKMLYTESEITINTLMWNDDEIKTWTALNKLPELLHKLDPSSSIDIVKKESQDQNNKIKVCRIL